MQVSVCITTCNRKAFVRSCLESVLAQTFADFEIIVCDDASTDGTWDIIRSFSDPRIRTHRSEQSIGMVPNWNLATSLARGTYIKPLHDDDLLDPRCLELQVAALNKRPDAVLVASGRNLVDAEGNSIGAFRFFSHEVVLERGGLVADMLIYGNILGEPSAVMFRREALVKVGPFSSTLPVAVDVEMWLRLTNQGKIVYLPELLSNVRRHVQMATKRNREEGYAAGDVLTIATFLLQNYDSTWCARRIAWGRCAGAIVKHAIIGFASGHFRWPAKALWRAVRLDPGFLGFVISFSLFRPGILGLRVGSGNKLRIGLGSTLDSSIKSGTADGGEHITNTSIRQGQRP